MSEDLQLSRRAVMLGGCGLACAGLTGCASYGPSSPATSAAAPPPAAPAGTQLARTADVPVGGGVVLAGPSTVLTQPVAGTYKAFSAICTHKGCAVRDVTGGVITCPCHGSTFAIADGAVVKGPAGRPLPEKTIIVQDGSIVLA